MSDAIRLMSTTTGSVTFALETCEEVIEKGLATFIEVGEALIAIRDGKLYRQEYSTFEVYCSERWGFTARRANQLIGAAEIGTIVPVENEGQARALAPLRDDPEAMAEVMDEVINDSPSHRPTAADIARKVDERLGRTPPPTVEPCFKGATPKPAPPKPITGLDGKSYQPPAPKPAPTPLTAEEQRDRDIEAANKRTARYLEQLTDVWPYFKSWAEGEHRDEIARHLLPPTVEVLEAIEKEIGR